MGVLGMQCSDRVSAHVEVKVVWGAHGGPAVVDGRDGDWRWKLRVLAIKGVVAGATVIVAVAVAAVVVVVMLGVAMGVVVVVVVVVFYLHLVGVVFCVVEGWFGVVWVVVEPVALCRLGVGVVVMTPWFIYGNDR